MTRFTSLDYALPQTRQILRDRLVRYLPAPAITASRESGSVMIADEAMLNFLENLYQPT